MTGLFFSAFSLQPRFVPNAHSRIVGGSSGGEGAIVSSAGSVIGIGSDIGGSIRMVRVF